MLLINLNAFYIQNDNSQGLMPTEILFKPCRKNVSQQQNKDAPILIDIFTFATPTYHYTNLKGL